MPDLERFVIAQAAVISTVLDELRAGRKRTHWMWFIFPQLAALGRSAMAKRYGLADLDEARAYLAHDVLGPRLLICTRLVNAVTGKSAHEIFGSPDDLKFRSCVTLFHRAAPDEGAFAEALRRYYGGVEDERTAELIGG
jgi:uncharacterized protein (DUF1810 family)